jgi:hypothetical protein
MTEEQCSGLDPSNPLAGWLAACGLWLQTIDTPISEVEPQTLGVDGLRSEASSLLLVGGWAGI